MRHPSPKRPAISWSSRRERMTLAARRGSAVEISCNGQQDACRCRPPGRDPGRGPSRQSGRGIRLRVRQPPAAARQYLSSQGHPRRAVAAGGLRRLRRQPARLPRLLRNPSRLLPDPGRRPAGADRGRGAGNRRGRGRRSRCRPGCRSVGGGGSPAAPRSANPPRWPHPPKAANAVEYATTSEVGSDARTPSRRPRAPNPAGNAGCAKKRSAAGGGATESGANEGGGAEALEVVSDERVESVGAEDALEELPERRRGRAAPVQDPGSHQAPPGAAGAGRQGRARQQGRRAHHLSLARRPLLRADAEHRARRRHFAQDHQRGRPQAPEGGRRRPRRAGGHGRHPPHRRRQPHQGRDQARLRISAAPVGERPRADAALDRAGAGLRGRQPDQALDPRPLQQGHRRDPGRRRRRLPRGQGLHAHAHAEPCQEREALQRAAAALRAARASRPSSTRCSRRR